MLGTGIAMWQICCTTSYKLRIVVSLSVDVVVQNVRIRCPYSGVRHYMQSFRHAVFRYNMLFPLLVALVFLSSSVRNVRLLYVIQRVSRSVSQSQIEHIGSAGQ